MNLKFYIIPLIFLGSIVLYFHLYLLKLEYKISKIEFTQVKQGSFNWSTFVMKEEFSNNYSCSYGIKCPNYGGVQLIKDAYLINNNGLVVDKSQHRYDYGYWFWGGKTINISETSYKYRFKNAISFVRIWEQHFQHATMGAFLKARRYCKWIKKVNYDIIVNSQSHKHVIQHACKGIPNDKFHVFKGITFFDKLYVIRWITSESINQGSKLTLAASPPNIVSLDKPLRDPNVVFYMQRKKSLGKRFVINEEDTIELIKKWCFKNKLEFKLFNPSNTLELKNAKVIIGPHGGAMGNYIFSNSETKIVEFITLKGLKQRPCYILASQSASLEYYFVEPVSFNFDQGGMVVNTTLLNKILTNIHI